MQAGASNSSKRAKKIVDGISKNWIQVEGKWDSTKTQTGRQYLFQHYFILFILLRVFLLQKKGAKTPILVKLKEKSNLKNPLISSQMFGLAMMRSSSRSCFNLNLYDSIRPINLAFKTRNQFRLVALHPTPLPLSSA